MHYTRDLGDEDVMRPLRNKWRIVHLLGNPIVLNTLTRIEKPGMTFPELQYFLCTTPPKRTVIEDVIRDLKEYLSDEPTLQFYLPMYSDTSQLGKDLRKLKDDGILIKDGDYWCLNPQTYRNLVHEWEQHQDMQAIGDYEAEELTRFGRYVRMYGVPSSLISEEERNELGSIASRVFDLVAQAYIIEQSAKVRTWNIVCERLESEDIPRAISSRLLNLFMWFVISPVMSYRVHYDDTSDLVLSQMLNAKEAQLMRKRMENKIPRKVSLEATQNLLRKYVRPPNFTTRQKEAQSNDLPEYLEEPPFSNTQEEEALRTLWEYMTDSVGKSEQDLTAVAESIPFSIEVETLGLLRDLWSSMLRGVTLVASTPRVPFIDDPWYFVTERDFVERLS